MRRKKIDDYWLLETLNFDNFDCLDMYDLNISLIFLCERWIDFLSGFVIPFVFTLPPRDGTLQYKRCVHL